MEKQDYVMVLWQGKGDDVDDDDNLACCCSWWFFDDENDVGDDHDDDGGSNLLGGGGDGDGECFWTPCSNIILVYCIKKHCSSVMVHVLWKEKLCCRWHNSVWWGLNECNNVDDDDNSDW